MYIFELRNSTWSLSASLVSPHSNIDLPQLSPHFGQNLTRFGHAISLDGLNCAVGAYGQSECAHMNFI